MSATREALRGRARDFVTLEPKMVALYEAALEDLEVTEGMRLLDVGCGPGMFVRLAAQRGARVAGIDAAAPFIEIARDRLPGADLVVGEMEALPYADAAFDVVTGFNAFELAADPVKALREAGRVARPGGAILIATWGRPEHCEAAGYLHAVGAPLPAAPPLEELALRGGLVPAERRDVVCVWSFPDEPTLLRALTSTGFAVKAIDEAAILAAVAPYRTSDGGYRLENEFTYLVALAGGAY